jgi:hypothetical protein
MEPSQKNKGRFLLCVKIIPRKTTKLQQTEPSLSAQNLLFHYTCYDSSLLHLRKNKINGKDYHRYQGVSG